MENTGSDLDIIFSDMVSFETAYHKSKKNILSQLLDLIIMKQIRILKILGMIILFSIMTVSCQKADQIDEPIQKPTNEFTDNKDYCGNTSTFALSNYFELDYLDIKKRKNS